MDASDMPRRNTPERANLPPAAPMAWRGCAHSGACRDHRSTWPGRRRRAWPPRPTGSRGPKPAVPDTALPAAIRADLARYNAQWLIEKNGHLSPHAQRRQHELAAMPMAA